MAGARRVARVAWRLSGAAAAAVALAAIVLAIHCNPWFDLFKHALSDLGGPRASDPWIYNYGLVAAGALASIYALYLASASSTKASTYASAFVFVAGLFLAMIGVFPSGTRPHTFVSAWFFVQMWMAMVASAADFLLRGARGRGGVLLAASLLGPLGAVIIKWPSVALVEVYGVSIVGLYVALLTASY